MGQINYVSYEHEFSSAYSSNQNYNYVNLAKHRKKGAQKILLVLDYMPTEDLKTGRLLSGVTGQLLKNILKVSNNFYKEESKLNDFDWLAVTYNAFKTAGETDIFKAGAKEQFKKRIDTIIVEYKPDIVITFGPEPYKALNGTRVEAYGGKLHHLFGVLTDIEVATSGKKHKCKHIPTLSLNSLLNDIGRGNEIALSGYVARNLANALHTELKYAVPKLNYKTILVDTIPKFKKMLSNLADKKYVCIDTETENLNRRVNKMLTIQFASSTDKAYVLPFLHKDSTFTSNELQYIAKKLRSFFESKNNNYQHIFANAKFDLTVIRNNCGVRYFKTDVWDIFAGEFCLDENLKCLSSMTGHYYYSLLNVSMQYGCTAYYDAEFGKDKRKTIATVDLDAPLLEYCSLDVIVPLHIARLQKQRAKDIGYEKYELMVGKQLSDMSHMFSTWEYNGCPTDIDYLFYLKTRNSPIRQHIEEVKVELAQTKGVKKANAILSKRKGVPTVGLLGTSDVQLFDISKQDHQQLLFFEVLRLKPLEKGKENAKGVAKYKIDKKFQKKYADVKEVALYTKLQKGKKLYNAYVKSFIKQWGIDEDMRFDRHIRPNFGFLDVVTGRTSAQKPSLHQVPSRGELGKHIKRLFKVENGRIMIKVDYSAHEVRCWSLFTGDKTVAKLFDHGLELRNTFRLKPVDELLTRVKLEGDVHKINAAYFFGVPIEKVDDDLRGAVKAVIFGLIYQQGLKGLSASTGQKLEVIEDLVAKFKVKHPVGVKWFEEIKAFARANLYVESPLGRRRHTWGFLMPKDATSNANSAISRNERQSVNSPIQGMGSDFLIIGARNVERLKHEHFEKTGHYPDFYQANSVHDSIIFSCAYEDLWLATRLIEEGLTSEVAKVVEERYGMEFIVPLEIDFEVGNNERDVKKWTGSVAQMLELVKVCVKERQTEDPKFDAKAVYKHIATKQYAEMPDWAKRQVWNCGIKMDGMVVDPRKSKTKESKSNGKAKRSSDTVKRAAGKR